MKKILNNQSGITLIELLVATIILGFVVSGVVLLSGSIVKTNTDSNIESQSIAYATIMSELIKYEYQNNPASLRSGSTVILESTVIDKNSTPNPNPDYSISQEIKIPKQDDHTSFEEIKYNSGANTGYQYSITNKLKHEQLSSDGVPGVMEKFIEITVTVKSSKTGDSKSITFRHNFKNS